MRPSEPLLDWIRNHIKAKGLNTAALAEKAGLPRGRTRKILGGSEPMELDEFLLLSQALDITPQDLGLGEVEVEGLEEPEEEPASELRVAAPHEEQRLEVNPWGNQVEQSFRFAFELGCDFLFQAAADELEGSGLPRKVLETWAGREVPIKLDAAYHQYNNPRYDPGGITLTLSFDALYECRFPWSAIRTVLLFPAPPEPELEPELEEEEEPAAKGAPFLRLV